MALRFPQRSRQGTILIMALWSLSLLTVFAVYLGVAVRTKITLQSRLEDRDKLYLLAESGIKKAIAVLNNDLMLNEYAFTAKAKQARHNNPAPLAGIALSGGKVDVSLVDEQSKIDLNKADLPTLQRLIKYVLNLDENSTLELAQAIYDWKEYGRSDLIGFYSEEYYKSLESPFSAKDAPFELLDELLLVKGMTKDIFRQLIPYVTVYGNNVININTASRIALLAAGLEEVLVDKILNVRRGQDGLEATLDDFIFEAGDSVILDLQKFVSLEGVELYELDEMFHRGQLGTNSTHYTLRAQASLKGQERKVITCVFDVIHSKIVYYREEESS